MRMAAADKLLDKATAPYIIQTQKQGRNKTVQVEFGCVKILYPKLLLCTSKQNCRKPSAYRSEGTGGLDQLAATKRPTIWVADAQQSIAVSVAH